MALIYLVHRACTFCFLFINQRVFSLALQIAFHRLTTSMGISYMVLCDASYPTVLAWSFLNDMHKEFVSTYQTRHVAAAVRPYAFIDFGKLFSP